MEAVSKAADLGQALPGTSGEDEPRPYDYIVVQPTVVSIVPSEIEAKVVGEPPFNEPKNIAETCELLL